ncbi:ORF164 [Staphylococcus phage EW]|uniref:ORF164 n=1 Tax=Staphylococcus phage EW TaxID=2936814 RepID=Q4ZC46_9CAUD|nr:ORF164 [Staphylococcus phage EW]AAX91413.1 ORF164 [Staphylococcus phage EW]
MYFLYGTNCLGSDVPATNIVLPTALVKQVILTYLAFDGFVI